MSFGKITVSLMLLIFTSMVWAQEHINTGRWSSKQIEALLKEAALLPHRERVELLSRTMLGAPYNDKTLIGSVSVREELVINLGEVDCFTFIDYIEAMRRSASLEEFKDNLVKVRYIDGKIDFHNRRHFFTDWAYKQDVFTIRDITREIGGNKAKSAQKTLNVKKDKSPYLNGLMPSKRTVYYIPSQLVDKTIIDRLQTGDYIGIFTLTQGLDVSHVGIFIRDANGRAVFRHASSIKGKVVDQDFMRYVSKGSGITVLRAE